MRKILKWMAAAWLATNQLVNAGTGGNPMETVSSRLGGARSNGSKFAVGACKVLGALDFAETKDEDHCAKARRRYVERLEALAEKAKR